MEDKIVWWIIQAWIESAMSNTIIISTIRMTTRPVSGLCGPRAMVRGGKYFRVTAKPMAMPIYIAAPVLVFYCIMAEESSQSQIKMGLCG